MVTGFNVVPRVCPVDSVSNVALRVYSEVIRFSVVPGLRSMVAVCLMWFQECIISNRD